MKTYQFKSTSGNVLMYRNENTAPADVWIPQEWIKNNLLSEVRL